MPCWAQPCSAPPDGCPPSPAPICNPPRGMKPFHHPASCTLGMGHSHRLKSGQSVTLSAPNAILQACNGISNTFRNWTGHAALCRGCAARQPASQSLRKRGSFCLPQSRRSEVPGLINKCLLAPANSDFSGMLPRLERGGWPCAREVLLPVGSIAGSSLWTVKLDNQEQREQQRRTRQVRAPNVTPEKRCPPLSQFKVLQVFKSSRRRSLILISNFKKGKKCKTNNQQILSVISRSTVTALLQSSLHGIFFACLPCSQSSPVCHHLVWVLTSQYSVKQRTERLELQKHLRERRQGRWEKPCDTAVGLVPSYMPFYTQVAFPSILPGYSASPCKKNAVEQTFYIKQKQTKRCLSVKKS